jgi:hypothetical protein
LRIGSIKMWRTESRTGPEAISFKFVFLRLELEILSNSTQIKEVVNPTKESLEKLEPDKLEGT